VRQIVDSLAAASATCGNPPTGSEKEPYAESLELGRFVLRDEVPANG
jgi:hypothetical protein